MKFKQTLNKKKSLVFLLSYSCKVKKKAAREQLLYDEIREKNYFFLEVCFVFNALVFFCLMTACAAANLAIGTLKGEQLT